jgi:hypothetical protein
VARRPIRHEVVHQRERLERAGPGVRGAAIPVAVEAAEDPLVDLDAQDDGAARDGRLEDDVPGVVDARQREGLQESRAGRGDGVADQRDECRRAPKCTAESIGE